MSGELLDWFALSGKD